jgi:hypothetical protein
MEQQQVLQEHMQHIQLRQPQNSLLCITPYIPPHS